MFPERGLAAGVDLSAPGGAAELERWRSPLRDAFKWGG
jgi:hypothetical protein